MADNFGLKIGVEGEKAFKQALADINQNFKVLGSEMQLVTSQFDKNDASAAALTARNTVLNKEIETQKEKISTLKAALDNAASSFGENDRRTQEWQIKLNKAGAELNGMERELNTNEKALEGVGDEMKDTAKDSDKLGAEVEKTGKDAEGAGGKFEKLGGVLKGVGAAMGASMAAIGTAATAAGKQLVDMADASAENADNIDKQSQRLGMSRQAFQEWDYILSQNGVSIDTMNTAMKSMTTAMADLDKGGKKGQETLAKLGVTTDDLKKLNQEEIFEKAVVALQKMPEGYEKARLAQQLFGKQGQEMLPMLNQSKGSVEELKSRAHELGMVMSDESVNAGVKFTDSMDTLKRTFSGVKNSIGAELLPGLTMVTDGLANLIVGNDGAAEAIKAGAQKVIGSISEILPAILGVFMTIIETVAGIAPDIITTLIDGITGNLPTLIESAASIITALLQGIIGALPALASGALDLVMALVQGILDNLPALLEAAIQVVVSLAAGIAAALPELIPAIIEAVVLMCQTLIENLPLILDAALQLIIGLADGLLAAIPVLIDALPAIILSLVDFLISSIPQIIDAGIKLLTSLVEALPTIIQSIVAAIPKIIDGIINAVIGAIPLLIDAGIRLLVSLIQALPQIITTIVKAIPQIISGIIDALIGNIDKIIMAGVQLLVALVENTPTIIIEIVKAIPKIITGIVDAIISFVPKLAEAGLNLIKGLWQGISDAGAWIWDKIQGFFGGIVDGIKGFFGIRSPSSLFRDQIGKNLALGIGEGFSGEMDAIARDMQDAIPTDFDLDIEVDPSLNMRGGGHGRAETAGGVGAVINQNISITSPRALSEKEAAREFKNLSRKLALAY